MQTIQEQPGRCLGCFVVAATDEVVPAPPGLSPRIAAFAKVSRPEEDSLSGSILKLAAANLCLLNSGIYMKITKSEKKKNIFSE